MNQKMIGQKKENGAVSLRIVMLSVIAISLILICGIWATTQLVYKSTYMGTFAAPSTKDEKTQIEAEKAKREAEKQSIRNGRTPTPSPHPSLKPTPKPTPKTQPSPTPTYPY